MAARALRIGIVAGEASGDNLGAALMASLQKQHPDCRFEGIGGPRMIAAGFHSLYPMERLSVMGLTEPLKRLPELLRIRAGLKTHFRSDPPDVFVGIDSPDFNLDLELALRESGIKTAHYVSPSVWAWRRGRVKKIARAVDLMLTLLPFEADFYKDHNVPVRFVGHPLADQIPLADQRAAARESLGIDHNDTVLAVLPGSRGGEVKQLAPVFFETVDWLRERGHSLRCLVPAASPERRAQLEQILKERSTEVELFDGQSREVMAAADAVLMASGTTTLEAMLFKRPMVVAYRMGAISYALLSPLVKAPHISLPNLLAGEALVPEFIQSEVRAEILGPLLEERLKPSEENAALKARFHALHAEIARDASDSAAAALLELIDG